MGAEFFKVVAKGDTAKEAFDAAVKQAEHDQGYGGYTGTIAEKTEFVMIEDVPGFNKDRPVMSTVADLWVNKLMGDHDPRIIDKWGPAGCIWCGYNKYMFFGWASC